jgi:hypothetical protein
MPCRRARKPAFSHRSGNDRLNRRLLLSTELVPGRERGISTFIRCSGKGTTSVESAIRLAKRPRSAKKCRPGEMRADSTIAMQFQAIDIAKNYFLRRGYREIEINAPVGRCVHQLMASGERRPLVLANRAIALVEKEGSDGAISSCNLFGPPPVRLPDLNCPSGYINHTFVGRI